MRRLLVAIAALGLVGRVASGFDIFTCGVTIPENDTGVLQADVSCGGAFTGVTVLDRGTLDMNGHLVTGVDPNGSVVRCESHYCTVTGPGEIVGAASSGVLLATDRAILAISGVDIHGVQNAILGFDGVEASKTRVIATGVALHDNGYGMIYVGIIKGDGIVASNNSATGLSAERRLTATNVTANGNGFGGMSGPILRVDGLTANGNGFGVQASRARIANATVTGNGIDLATIHRPRLTNVTCGTSNWGVCAND